MCICLAKVEVSMCCPGVRGTLLEHHRQRAFVFYLGLRMFSCNITGTWFKSNGLVGYIIPHVKPIIDTTRCCDGQRLTLHL